MASDWQARLSALILEAAEMGKKAAMEDCQNGRNVRLYLYYLPCEFGPGHREWGKLGLFRDGEEPEGWELGWQEPILSGLPFDRYTTWVRERSGRLSVCGTCLE